MTIEDEIMEIMHDASVKMANAIKAHLPASPDPNRCNAQLHKIHRMVETIHARGPWQLDSLVKAIDRNTDTINALARLFDPPPIDHGFNQIRKPTTFKDVPSDGDDTPDVHF